ncbi:MAG: hypothetical protein ABR577_07500 [Pyrinomonadaceae bacterium]
MANNTPALKPAEANANDTNPIANEQYAARQNARKNNAATACTLLTSSDIEAVQGEIVKDAKATILSNGGFNISQCFYTLPTFFKSVSFEITRGAAGAKNQNELREVWESKFGRDAGKKDKDREEEEERESEGHRPERVNGVGREAFWVAGRSGALYVLTNKNAYLRISIGGNESDQTKITKTKTLAQQAIKRL